MLPERVAKTRKVSHVQESRLHVLPGHRRGAGAQVLRGELGLKSGSAGNQGDNWWVEYDLPGGGCT
jgi:hypothetical protein